VDDHPLDHERRDEAVGRQRRQATHVRSVVARAAADHLRPAWGAATLAAQAGGGARFVAEADRAGIPTGDLGLAGGAGRRIPVGRDQGLC